MTEQVTIQENNVQVHNPDYLLSLAVQQNFDVDKLEKLLALKEKWDAAQAKKAFISALTDFQNQCPDLRKTKKVSFGQGKAEYNYAPLGDIDRQIKGLMRSCGMSKRWEIKDIEKDIEVTCIITHIDGHSEMTTMKAAPDSTGSKNAIQAKGSTIEYLKRYTLIGALGISTADSDVDAQQPEIDMDILHKQYMEHYNQLINIDKKFSKWHPDNWQTERTGKVYIRAISEIRKKLAEVTPKEI